MNLGIVQTALKKYQQAEISYQTALKHRPFYPDCYFNLGNLYLEQGLLSQALAAWNNATNQRPTHGKAWINQLILYDSQEQCDRAVALGLQGLRYLSDNPGIHFSVGSCLGKLGRLEEAEKHILQAIRADPDNANYYGNLGSIPDTYHEI